VTAGADRAWQLTATSIKPWPCCRHTHPAIDAAIGLHHELGGAALRAVRVGVYRAALDVCDRPRPDDPYSAKFSLQHCVAIALADGRVDQASFQAAARGRIASERAKVAVELDPAVDAAYPKAWGVEVWAETAEGRTLHAMRRHAKGDSENPVTAEELSAKARGLVLEGGMPARRANALVASVLRLPEDGPVRALKLFAPAEAGRPAQRLARTA
jgi:2-methylcitrate dehydratase PrpD